MCVEGVYAAVCYNLKKEKLNGVSTFILSSCSESSQIHSK